MHSLILKYAKQIIQVFVQLKARNGFNRKSRFNLTHDAQHSIYGQCIILIAWKLKNDIIFDTNTTIIYLIYQMKRVCSFIWNEQEYVDR